MLSIERLPNKYLHGNKSVAYLLSLLPVERNLKLRARSDLKKLILKWDLYMDYPSELDMRSHHEC